MDPVSSETTNTTGHRAPLAACTVIARNYLAQARVLAESYLRHETGAKFYLLVIDGLPLETIPGPDILVVSPSELGIPNLTAMYFKYDITEMSTAVKPRLLSLILNRYGHEAVAYFDPDIVVMRPLDELREALATGDIVLTPHLLSPIPVDGCRPSEQDILIAGAYNLGFIALRRSDAVAELLEWWDERLRDNCRVDPAQGLFVDQKWVDLVPSLFKTTVILRDDTYNVAYWNLHSRAVDKVDGTYLINGRPAAFVHFSGFDLDYPHNISRHQNRREVHPDSPLADLLDDYAGLLVRHGNNVTREWHYRYGSLSNGVPIHVVLRRLYLSLTDKERERFGDPFRAESEVSFARWATTPHEAFGGLSPFLSNIYNSRSDVARLFPEPGGKDRAGFISWAKSRGASEFGYALALACEDGLMRNGVADSKATASGAAGLAGFPNGPTSIHGVNVCGYLRNEDGIGAVARSIVRALEARQIPHSLKDLSELSPQRAQDPTISVTDREHPYDINVVCVNADQHFVVKSHVGDKFFDGRYNIGVWFWEMPRFPDQWHDRFGDYDEIWAASSFIANALSPVSPIPVVRMPPILTARRAGSSDRGRRRLGVGPDDYIFLFIFDFHSYAERKNPLAAIEAFKLAFQTTEPACLVIKCVNGDSNPDTVAAMRALSRDSRIQIIEGYWDLDDLCDLKAASNAYVSLHRSEGFGLTIADAMALSKPVIATGWSGNMDYMSVSNSFPVQYELVELSEDVGPYARGMIWANPSVPHAAELMRHVYDDRADASERGSRAKREIEANYSEERLGRLIEERLEVIGERRAMRRKDINSNELILSSAENPQAGAANQSREPKAIGLQVPSMPEFDASASLYGWPGRLVKRVVSFLLGYHTFYQQAVNERLLTCLNQIVEDRNDTSRRLDGLFDDVRQQVGRGNSIDSRMASTEHTIRDVLQAFVRSETKLDRVDQTVNELAQSNQSISVRVDQIVRELAQSNQSISDRVDQTVNELAQSNQSICDDVRVAGVRLEELAGSARNHDERLIRTVDDIAQVGYRFAVRPYMAQDAFGALGDLSRPMGYGLDAADLPGRHPTELRFADLFRGSEPFIKERQRAYLPFVRAMKSIVDLGCGRGEFLELLKDEGIRGVGIELDSSLVESCVAKGLDVTQSDALEFLQRQSTGSLDVIFSAQVIEHLSPTILTDLLALAVSRLRPGGLFIAETVNPECYEALKTFFVDLTHEKPIYPQVLLQMCRVAGFLSARIFYPVGGGFTQVCYDKAGEYAIVAVV